MYYRNVICIDVVATLIIISRLKLETRLVIRKNICKPIFRSIHRKISSGAELITTHSLELFKFFRETEIRISRHFTVVFRKVLQFYWTTNGEKDIANGISYISPN